jgi:phage terminase large subunit-like protein
MGDLRIPPMPKGAEAYGAYWDEAAAQAACAFFPRYLRHTEGEWAGNPFHLAAWQRDDIIRPIFGWKRADGTRLIRIVWIEVPRKNGKTELAAGVSVLALLGDGEFGGQVYSMAVDKDQASIVWNKAGVMVQSSPDLLRHLEVFATSIYCPELRASFKPLSKGPKGKHGFSPSAAIGDEVHEWPDGELADVVHKGTAARRQPLEVYITSAGVAGEGYAWEMHELAMQILSGEVVDPTFLAVVYAAPEDADWKAEETHRKANPGYGVSPKAEYIRKEAEDAARNPRKENDFKRFHLNIWTEQTTRWLSMDAWKLCTEAQGDPLLWRRMEAELRGERCYAGLDLAITNDLSAWCLVFPPAKPGERFRYLWRFWLPRDTIEDQPLARRLRYKSFEDAGALTVTPGNVTDYAFIKKSILEDAQTFKITQVGIDKFNASQLAVDLLNNEGLPIVWVRQGFLTLSAPSKEFERMVLSNEIEHGNNPVAKWMAQNAAVERDAAGNIKPTKEKAANKIDGISAAVTAMALFITPEGGAKPSVYESRGLRTT